MNIRLYNARILTLEAGMDILSGEVHVRGNRIAAVYEGEAATEPAAEAWDREIDVMGNLIMPGFKNAHTHSAMTFLRSYADDLPLSEWLNQQVFPMEAKLTSEDMYHLSRLAILEYLTSGITSAFDMYLDPWSMARASADCGFRTVLTGAVNNFSQSLQELEVWYKELNAYDELVSFVLGAHAEYTMSQELLEGLSALAHRYKAPVFLHNSETKEEVEGCIARYGKTPTAFLDELGVYDYGGGGYHCVYMTEEDLNIFKQKGLYVVENPASNLKLASGIAPTSRMIELGIPVAIGTDGPASNNCLDMFREMFLTTGLGKIREMNAAAIDANTVLKMATVTGAEAMGLTECRTLGKGQLADLIIIDLNQPNMQPLNHITKNIVYSGSKQNVKMTMINGKIVYEDGKFYVGCAPEEIYKEANRIINRMR